MHEGVRAVGLSSEENTGKLVVSQNRSGGGQVKNQVSKTWTNRKSP